MSEVTRGVLERVSLDSDHCIECKYYEIELTLIDGCAAWRYPTSYPIGYFIHTFKHMHPEWDGVPDVYGDDDGDMTLAADVFLDLTLLEYNQLVWEVRDGWNIRKSRINTEG